MTFLFRNSLFAIPIWRKTIRAMKLITLLIFTGVMQIHAAVYSQKSVNLKVTNTTVKEVLKEIEKNSGYTVFYKQGQVDLTKKVTVFAENSSIESVMKQVLVNQPLTFEIVEDIVVIKSNNEVLKDYTVSGTVTDTKGEPLIGASVTIKGSTKGTSTDINGKFKLTIPGEQAATIVVKYIGFQNKEVGVTPSQANLTIQLAADAAALEEVVVIGYGTVKKRDLTGAVSSIKSDDINRMPTSNFVEAIQGKIPGADITRASGVPGSGANITIRGTKSLDIRDRLAEKNGPLYIIDGFQGGDITAINPNDIESIDVLKDASSTAIYGAQGANGVIIVTTKKGTAGKTKVSYHGYYCINDYIYPDLRIGDSYTKLRREAGKAAGNWSSPADDPKVFMEAGEISAYQSGQWIDWINLVGRNGAQQNHTISVNGGSEKTKISSSLGYFNETGMVRNSDYSRFTGRFNLDQSINKWAKAGVQTQVTYSKQNRRNDPLAQAMSIAPLGTAFEANGDIDLYPLVDGRGSVISPLADEKTDYVARDQRLNTNILANGFVEVTPLKGLSFKSSLGTNFSFGKNGLFNDKESLARYSTNISQASIYNSYSRFLNWDNILTYNKKVKDHNVTLTGVVSYLQSDLDETSASGINQVLSSQLFYNLGSTSNDAGARTISTTYTGWNNLAYIGRLNYGYRGKYLLTLSGRADGASRLSKGNEWSFFPSAAVAWNISDENFFEPLRSVVSNLKLRAGYGVSGNYSVAVYGTQSVLAPFNRMGFGEVSAPAYVFGGIVANENLGWETSAATNIGLDVGLLKNRISAALEVYNTVTSHIILPRDLPLSSGVSRINQNVGETQNRGIELSINSTNINKKNFRWSSTFTFSRNREKITSLINGTDIIAASGTERNSWLIGRPVSSFYSYKKLGIWQLNEADIAKNYKIGNYTFQPGDIKLADLNNDGTFNASDYTYLGSTVPKWVGGIQNNISYKAFDMNIFVVARVGQMIDAEFLGRYNPAGTGNSFEMIDYWTPENPTNDFPRPRAGSSLSSYQGYTGYQALNFVDGSYVKLRNVSLGYTLPANLSKKLGAGKVRFYATGSNLFTINRSHLLKNYDPEGNGSTAAPLSRQFVFGVNLDL